MDDCYPIILVGDLFPHQQFSVSGKPLPKEAPAIPCGLTAKYVFNDTFTLVKDGAGADDYKIDSDNIAWQADKDMKFENQKGKIETELANGDPITFDKWEDAQWMDMEDEHYIVWMRSAIRPTFRKLYGKIKDIDRLSAGKYTF